MTSTPGPKETAASKGRDPFSLEEQARRYFSTEDLRFGRFYRAGVKLRPLDSPEKAVAATVYAKKNQEVLLRREGRKLRVHCGCYFSKNLGRCGHVWAAVLEASSQGLLRGSADSPVESIEREDPETAAAAFKTLWSAPGKTAPGTEAERTQRPSPRPRGFEEDEDEEEEEEDRPDSLDGGREEGLEGVRADPFGPKGAHQRLGPREVPPGQRVLPRSGRRAPGQAWRSDLEELKAHLSARVEAPVALPGQRSATFTIDVAQSGRLGCFAVEILVSKRLKSGKWGKGKPLSMPRDGRVVEALGAAERRLVELLSPASPQHGHHSFWSSGYPGLHVAEGRDMAELVPLACGTGKLFLQPGDSVSGTLGPLALDPGPPWAFAVSVAGKGDGAYRVEGVFRRASEILQVSEPKLIFSTGWLFTGTSACRWSCGKSFRLMAAFRQKPSFLVPLNDGEAFVAEMLSLPDPPEMLLPEELAVIAERPPPRPRLVLALEEGLGSKREFLASLSFLYGGGEIPWSRPGEGLYDPGKRRLLLRDREAETRALERLSGLGIALAGGDSRPELLEVPVKSLRTVIATLAAEGWQVEAQGRAIRSPGRLRLEVKSGMDWFDLEGRVEYGETTASLPALLRALGRGENTVLLADGTLGMVPEEFLESWALLAGLGETAGDALRFTRSQAGLLEVLLAGRPEVSCDEVFAKAREELGRFEGLRPSAPPEGFVGTLRDYQQEGLGWLHFLGRFGFGGCLADDMGLGKTIQALALLEARARGSGATEGGSSGSGKPSLVVVPRSLMFNWREEAARFTPKLRVLEHAGLGRSASREAFLANDVVLTTYGTLRRDAALLSSLGFDYVILDEAQAIKNSGTASAKAARLLEADHRLALSGTPVENRLAELWSLFEFLNPGMLGSAPAFEALTSMQNPTEGSARDLLRRALKPFILRRTKSQVAKELPEKTEQTIHCVLEGDQRALYDELLLHYRNSLLGRAGAEGGGRSKMLVIEALLRLRQAACHPGLIDKARAGETSAKVESLLARLEEVLEGGHKALVFSQFTSFLALVRSRLDHAGIVFEYLDGRTKDRGKCVDRFQNDPECRLFLISLKAGGLGLNLTAAEYVFLLDPWWNPAVEAQAIDRTHRIGQKRRVFAYRLIARDTVEEKLLALQEAKRDLAEAIVGGDGGFVRGLTREDLELLLS